MTNPRSTDSKAVVTSDDVAKHCGVHRSTVRRVMCNDPRISKATAQRVWAAARAIGYDPTQHTAARRLALQKHGRQIENYVVGGVFPVFFQRVEFYRRLYRGVLETLEHEGYALLTSYYHLPYYHHPDRPSRDPDIPPALMRGEVDGLLIAPGRTDLAPFLSQLAGSGNYAQRPIVTVLQTIPGIPAVLTDDTLGGYLATKHLLELGHRDLLQLYPEQQVDDESMRQRIMGVRQAMREYGVDADAHLHRLPVDLDWLNPATLQEDIASVEAGGEDLTHDRLLAYADAHANVTAILAVNDACALRARHFLLRHGCSVPGEYSIVGFDGTDAQYLDGACPVSLSTITLPLEEVGKTAAQLLLDLIAGATSPRSFLLPATLTIGDSTGVCRMAQAATMRE